MEKGKTARPVHIYNISEIHDETSSVISDKKGIANRINEFFVNIGSKLASKFPASDTSKIQHVKSANKTFNFKLFTATQVKKVLDSLDSKKSSGIDGINVRLLKEGSTALE